MDAELNLAILFSLSRYLRDEHGEEVFAEAASRADVSVDDVLKGKRWVSVEQVEAFAQYIDDLLEGDEIAFRKAAIYRLGEAYGPLRFILWALNPKAVSKKAMDNIHVVSSSGAYEVLGEGPRSIRVRFTSPRERSRHLCLMRQANMIAMPTFWGLPPAEVTEERCLGDGDEECIYDIKWRREQSWLPFLVGLGAGAATALAAALLDVGSLALWIGAPALGASVGHIVRLRRLNRANILYAQESNEALEQLAREATEARQEIIALSSRQREWSSLMEEQLVDRSATLEKVIETVKGLQKKKVAVVRDYSHDLRSPLTVMKCASAMMRELSDTKLPDDIEEVLDDLVLATAKMERILDELMSVVATESLSTRNPPEKIDVHAFADKVRRQLRAFVYGRDVRVSAFCSREAPESIDTDRLLFDRIVDNLLINAVKYTEKGSIVVEVDGIPGYLSVKISDTGRGIADDEIEHIFRPGGSSTESRADRSYGLGLSVVVKLLDDIGGRLEVLSKPGQGTTF